MADRGFSYNDFIISSINYMLQQKIQFTQISHSSQMESISQYMFYVQCLLLVLHSSYEANVANKGMEVSLTQNHF